MNEQHLLLCASAEWAERVHREILPWVLEDLDLGDDVLEVGPGPGLSTEVLRATVAHLTAVEIDPELAAALALSMAETNVDVICADAAETGLEPGRFTGAICLTMLHHVPTVARQDAVFTEVHRLLRPGGVLAGRDSLDRPELRELHHGDIFLPLDPATLGLRLESAGFCDVHVDSNDRAVRFRATRP